MQALGERRRVGTGGRACSTHTLEPADLAEIASRLASITEPWELRAEVAPTERQYRQVLVNETHDVWVIYWPTGGALDLHDHGGSAGSFCVVSGHLDEAHLEHGRTEVRRVGPGQAVSFSARHVHTVANLSPAPATSVHVYSPPLGPMAFYDRDADGRLVEIERSPAPSAG